MKKLFFFALALSAAFALASCQAASTTAEATEPTAESTSTTVITQSTTATQKPAVHKHTFGEWVILSESTCGERGKQTRYCTECGEADSITNLPPVAHNYESEVIAPTKSEDGYTKFTCTECGKSYTQDPVPALGSQGLAYIPLEDKSYDKPYCAVIGIGFCTDTEIVIPSNVDGYEVLAIYSEAFKDQTHITSITIPDTVTSFHDRAFQGCTGLTEFTFPKRTMVAGKNLFQGCDNLETINFCCSSYAVNISEKMLVGANAVKTISFDSRYVDGDFCRQNTTIETVIIKSGVREIESSAFYGCQNLKNVIFEDAEERWLKVGTSAFEDCQSLSSVTFSYAISSIDNTAFWGCSSLSSIVLNKNAFGMSASLFAYCPIESIYYMGTEEDWEGVNAIEGNPTIAAAKRYYYSEEPVADGNHWHYEDGAPVIWK